MYLWDDTIKSNREPKKIHWNPYCFVRTVKESPIKSIFGDNVQIKEFQNYYGYQKFCSLLTQDSARTTFENDVKPEIQFCVEKYYSIPDDNISKPKLYYTVIDIEVDTTKLDTQKIVKCRIDGAEDFYTLPQIKRLHKLPEIQAADGTWVPFDEKIFLASYGFPEPSKAERPICAITGYNSQYNKTYTFGLKEYTGEGLKEDWWEYFWCKDEKILIDKFLKFMNFTCPDIITGWNLYKFDMPYIINRIRNLYPGESDRKSNTVDRPMDKTSPKARQLINMLSPIGIVNFWESSVNNDVTRQSEARMNVDIAGISILDYMDMYKQYSGSRLESYSLDFVSKHELEKGKLEYSQYKNLTELYNYDYNMYIDYNVIDVKRVKQLQEKLGYIELIQALSLLTKCPMKFYGAVTHLSEGAFLTYYRRNNLCAPYAPDGTKEEFPAAIVKEPVPALYKWIIDMDISSSYPAQMITMNMGIETYVGIIRSFIKGNETITPEESEIVDCVRAREFPPFTLLKKENDELVVISGNSLKKFNEKLANGKYAIAPNGVIFKTDERATIAEVERYLFYKRVEVREKQKEIGKLRDQITDKESKEFQELSDKVNQMKNLQMAIKVCLNGTYGALSVPYFRLFEPEIPKAITAGGRWSILNGERFINEIGNDPSRSPKLMSILAELKQKKNSTLESS
jgi:DNA polymerase elongation subunit (family B)